MILYKTFILHKCFRLFWLCKKSVKPSLHYHPMRFKKFLHATHRQWGKSNSKIYQLRCFSFFGSFSIAGEPLKLSKICTTPVSIVNIVVESGDWGLR